MAQLLVRNVEPQLKTQLQQRARRHGRSMEAEAREILRSTLLKEEAPSVGLGTAISDLFRDCGLEQDIEELRGFPVKLAEFES